MPAAGHAEKPAAEAPQPGQVPPAFRKDPGALIGQAAGAAVAGALGPLLAAMPEAIVQHLRQALAELAASDGYMCAKCAYQRARVTREHGDLIRFAMQRAEADGAEGDPVSVIAAYLPEEMRPDPGSPLDENRLPVTFRATTALGGTLLCDFHVAADEAERASNGAAQPGTPPQPPQPGQQQQARPILVAPAMSASAAAAAAKVNAPGVPGYASP
jgi:hypothetical protein